MNYLDVVKEVSSELSLPEEVVSLAYKSYWKFIKQTIQSFSLKKNLTEEEFNSLRTNFNVPSLGKFTLTYDRYLGLKKRIKHIKQIEDAKNKEN